jgi:hypothetical protein
MSILRGDSMAEEKKPKIDLKARLGKTAAQPSVPVPGASGPSASGLPSVIPGAAIGRPQPMSIPAAVPVPPGVPVGPPPPFASTSAPALDPSNPLSAVASPYRPAPSAAPVVAAPQRIEVDEIAVQQARAGATKRGFVITLIAGVLFAGVGVVAGQGMESGNARAKSKNDAVQLAEGVTKAKATMTALAEKMEAGRNTLVKERKFPDALVKELGGLNVDFDGTMLAGRRFSGFPQDTTQQLVDFVTSVQALNDRKTLIQGLLTKLQKPLTEQLNAPQGQQTISYVAIVSKDPAGNPSALLAPLTQPILFTPPNVTLPAEYTFADPLGQGNSKLDRYKGGDIAAKPGAVYVVPKTFEKACPSESSGQSAQLAVQIGNVIRDIRGEGQASQDIVSDAKPGLLERADKLVLGLQKVQ